jgi:rod shape-determining protein MreD
MNKTMAVIVTLVSLWVAGALQVAVAHRVAFWGFHPDFVLVFVVQLAFLMERSAGAITGFLGGVVHAAVVGAHLGTYAASRAVAGFVAAWVRRWGVAQNSVTVAAVVFGCTVLAQLLFLFLSPPRDIVQFLGDTIRSATYNGVLAMPVYALLRRILAPGDR